MYVDSVWRRIYKALSIPAGESFPSDGIPDARDFLFLRLALARADAYLPRHIAVQRSRAYRLCHDVAGRWGLEDQMRRHMLRSWGAKSMRELENEHLRSLENHMLDLETRYERAMGC